MAMEISEQVEAICRLVQENGGRALVVGGWVRDDLLGVPSFDYDLEVYSLAADDLLRILGERYELDLVGAAFGVIKIKGQRIDISIPRQDSRLPRCSRRWRKPAQQSASRLHHLRGPAYVGARSSAPPGLHDQYNFL